MTAGHIARVAAATGSLLLLLAGCGGDKALTKSEWIAQAEAICIRAGDELDKLDPDNFDSQTEFAGAVNDAFAAYIADLRVLTSPPDDQATITEWLDLQVKLAEARKRFLVSDGGQRATETFSKTAAPISKRADRLIRRFGAAKCAVD